MKKKIFHLITEWHFLSTEPISALNSTINGEYRLQWSVNSVAKKHWKLSEYPMLNHLN